MLGLIVAAATGILGAAFVAGETFDDPGGWKAVGLVALWLVPALGLVALSWWAPHASAYVLAVLTALTVLISLSSSTLGETWARLENGAGPIRAILALVLLVPLAVLAYRRPRLGGTMLVVIGVFPPALAVLTAMAGHRGPPVLSLSAMSTPALLSGVCFLLASYLSENNRHDSADTASSDRR